MGAALASAEVVHRTYPKLEARVYAGCAPDDSGLIDVLKTYGFRVAPAIRDRVIYKELFLQGLTVLDLSHEALKCRLSVSHIAAKQEIKSLAEFICP